MNTDAIRKVEQACAELTADQQPITFTTVAARTGLGRTTLYRNPSLRALIEDHRHRAAQAGTLSGLADDITTLRAAVEAIAGRVRRHEEQLRQITKHRH
jgi:sugar (pentulose or hexulose) kinase